MLLFLLCFELLVPPKCCQSGTVSMGPTTVSTATVSKCLLQESACLTDLDRVLAIGQLQAGVLQNQVAALFGVSPSTISRLKAKFHITGVKDRPRSGRPKKAISSPCQHLGAVGCLLQICSQSLQDDMANSSLPRQYGTDCTQPISGLIGLPGVLP